MTTTKTGRVLTPEHKEKIRSNVKKGHMALRQVSKLSWDIVREIRAKYKTGEYTQKQLAEEYGLVRANVSQIVRNKTWIEDQQDAK